ncbi:MULTISPECIES: hypothetical protein [unclassified Pseudomonas]|uniref:hypothetical protein n=1 Tax=unclassified Pseudomonas TaxID=196821 RepID=UPI0021BA77BC|nr:MULTISPECIES: hypothetical protein [unclassified Pseudomonas]MCT8166874.1 hypothetical protein [Pseudomonas sp. HD6422]MCT8185756.1 hypothetical protein [Pseudomonas sp. HD6421]
MVSVAPVQKRNRIYVEVRECEGCNHIGIDDAHSTLGACHECDWSGPEPVEDKCPGCGRKNVIAAACPDCGSRYVLATSKEFEVPAPQPHPDPIAWMVGTAFWWTKEEAERDAAETGLQIVGLGPMTGAAPAEQHQGEPVAVFSIDASGYRVRILESACSSLPADGTKLYTHADPNVRWKAVADEQMKVIEGLRAQLAEAREDRNKLGDRYDAAEAKLAERDALLRDLEGKTILSWPDKRRISAALSASAEPIAPAAQPGKCLDGGDCGLGGTCKWCPHTSPSPARQHS